MRVAPRAGDLRTAGRLVFPAPGGGHRLPQLAESRLGAGAEQGGSERHVSYAAPPSRDRADSVRVNAKVAQTLARHHAASFTLDQYPDAVPEQLEETGGKVASVLLKQAVAFW